jgi:hypothetical protein
MDFYEGMSFLDDIGGFDILLPFLLVFTLVFAVLQKIKLFGDSSKKVNAVVALVLGIFFLQNTYLVYILQRFLPNISIILVVFLMFLLLLGVFGGKGFTQDFMGIAFVVAVVSVFVALMSDVFRGDGILGWYYDVDPGTRFMVWLLIFVAIFVGFIMKDDNKDGFLKGLSKGIEKLQN